MTLQQISSVAVRNVAVATDFSPYSERPVQHALAIARHFGARLHFLHLVQPSKFLYVPETLPEVDSAAARDYDQLLKRLKSTHQLDGIELHRWVEEGEVSQVVGAFVRELQIDILVVGTHGRAGVPRLLLGSVAQEIFHYVHCAVLTVGPGSPEAPELQPKRILFSTDLSPDSLAALPWVFTAVREWHTKLDLLHVCSLEGVEHARLMEDLRSRMEISIQDNDHSTVQGYIVQGNPAACVLQFATNHGVDLIVLGLKPRTALYEGPLWSNAYEIVRHASCPVLSVREETVVAYEKLH